MKWIVLAVAFLGLGACQITAPEADEDSPLFSPPPGSRFLLKQELTIPANSAHVTLQGGHVVSDRDLNEYHPYCRLEVQQVHETPQTVLPDEFVVRRVAQETHTSARTGFIRTGGESDGAPNLFVFRTILDLASARQPQVRWLTCEQWGEASFTRHVTLREIRTALGAVFSLVLAPVGPADPAR